MHIKLEGTRFERYNSPYMAAMQTRFPPLENSHSQLSNGTKCVSRAFSVEVYLRPRVPAGNHPVGENKNTRPYTKTEVTEPAHPPQTSGGAGIGAGPWTGFQYSRNACATEFPRYAGPTEGICGPA